MPNENKSSAKVIVENVSKIFLNKSNTVTAIKNLSFSVDDGEFLCLVGPSGCGKSTLLYLIAGLDFPDQGGIFLDGHPVTSPGNDRVVMFQESALFPWLNVLENVLFGLRLKKNMNEKARKEIALFYLRLMGLEKFVKFNIHELSGGMKQRVALARALAIDPQVLLMDEPFASLDALTREQLYIDIQSIWKDQKKTILFVTHNVAEAACLGDRVILVSRYKGETEGQKTCEFRINLPRLRDIRDLKVAKYASEITHELRKNY